MESIRERIRPPSVGRFFATFGYAWLMIGLFVGTVVLVVAVRGILDLIQKAGWGQTAQDRVLMAVIGLFIIGSFILARAVVRSLYRQPARTRRIALGALAVPAIFCAYAWSNPTRFLTKFAGTASTSLSMLGGPSFIFGAYPDENDLRALKKRGVKTVISLQDPRVVVELEGIKSEREATEKLGLTFIQAPMLPWVSDNTQSLELIRQIALHGRGTYYVHCGLGRDRTNIAKRVIESVMPQNARLAATKGLKRAVSFESRTAPFERGRAFKLAPGVWVVPRLNDMEFYGYIVQGQPGHVVLALNPHDTVQASFAAKAQRDMQQYVVEYSLLPTTAGDTGRAVLRVDTTPAALNALIAKLRAQRPPFTVMIPRTAFEEKPREPLLKALLKAYGQ